MLSQLLATHEIQSGDERPPERDETHLMILIDQMVREGRSERDIDRAVRTAAGH